MNIIFKTSIKQKNIFANCSEKQGLPTCQLKTTGYLNEIFDEQVWLSNAFKQNITKAVADIDFAYPTDHEKITQMVQDFLQSSLQLLKNKLNNVQI